jgi:hypothetical protein
MDLRSGSPAIDAGDNATCAAAPVSNLDQRGRTRPLDGDGDSVAICDLGAVEKGEPTITTITAHTPDPSTPNQNVALTVTVSGGTTTPTGIVDITGVDTFCGIGLSGGTGSCNTTFTTVGNKRLVATYQGDATHARSGDTETHNVWLMMKFLSQPGKDGWVLESTETGGVGGSLNATATTLRVGDNAQDRQFRSILSFNTADLPDGATITKVQVFVKQSSVTGTNPVDTHGGLRVDIQEPFFGSGLGLALHDFQAGAGLLAGCTIGATPTAAGWYRGNCTATTFFSHINKTGTTQLRLRFNRDDNDDNGADVLNLFSGNAISGNRPYIVVWFLP